MGWVNLTGGISYYSIADDMEYIHNNLLDFLISLTPGMYALLITTMVAVFIGLLVWSIAYQIKRLPI